MTLKFEIDRIDVCKRERTRVRALVESKTSRARRVQSKDVESKTTRARRVESKTVESKTESKIARVHRVQSKTCCIKDQDNPTHI